MPSALETLVKILKLEQETGYRDTAVIGGLKRFAEHWVGEARQQAKRPEHHALVNELAQHLAVYDQLTTAEARHESIKYMLGRITGRIPAPANLTASGPTADSPTQEKPGNEQVSTALTTKSLKAAPSPPKKEIMTPQKRTPSPAAAQRSRPPRRARRPQLSPEEAAERFEALKTPVTVLPKVGDKMTEKLQRLGVETVGDLLFTFPRRYDDYTHMRTLNSLRPGEVTTVIASVRSVAKKQGRGGRPYLQFVLDDGTGLLRATFFGQLWLQRQFRPGSMVVLSGKVDYFRGEPVMTNPEWEMLERENLHTNRIVPVYPLTKGLSARTMRRLVREALSQWGPLLPDYLPESVVERTDLPDLQWALQQIHFPDSFEWLEHARRRLSFDELFIFQMAVLGSRRDWQSTPSVPVVASDEWLAAVLDALPFQLTAAQERALDDIRRDLARNVPMNRLLQGDVGSGKTVVAALALAIAAQGGKQAALMAPTTILAEQHAKNITRLLHTLPGGDSTIVRLLTGNTSEAERQEIYSGLEDGRIHIVIGTHALIQSNVVFHDLALVIIDEQHRFGVEQRGTLRGKGTNPHLLVMTATPIPRTLALTLYADLDLSIIDEMPPGRTPIETRVLQPPERERAYAFIRSQVDKGRQAFIVYPLIESSESQEDVGAAVEGFERLQREIFPRFRIGLLHGRMSPAEKESMMASFAAGEIDILVTTSVIEVGIDIPNASVILIENAERFGLAQLHQFRGRVGRGEQPSFCLLMAGTRADEALQRLHAVEATSDGFKLAEIDWQLRGAGDLLGVRQSGIGAFRLAELMNPRLVELAQREARTVYTEDPYLEHPEHHLLAQRIRSLTSQRADVS